MTKKVIELVLRGRFVCPDEKTAMALGELVGRALAKIAEITGCPGGGAMQCVESEYSDDPEAQPVAAVAERVAPAATPNRGLN